MKTDKIDFLGSCVATSNTSFSCICPSGWQDLHCETKINYCGNVTCLNNAVCRPLLLGYKCECLTSSFSGRYCEQKANDILIKEIVAESLAYVAILAICIVMLFIIVLDVLKYVFQIDVVEQEHKQLKKKRVRVRRKPPVTIKVTHTAKCL